MSSPDKKLFFGLPLLLAWLMSSAAWAAPIPVFVSILPQKFIVEQIGTDLVDVEVMVSPGASPHTYEPKPGQMAALSKAQLYFSVGVSFEKVWLPRFTDVNRQMQVVPMDQGIEKLTMTDHGHGDENGHGHTHADHHNAHDSQLDPHIWLSPPLVKIMARHALDALIAVAPMQTERLKSNYDNFARRVDALHSRIEEIMADRQGERFMVFHPSWGYFANTYGLIQIPIEMDGKEPKPAQLRHLIQAAQENGIKVVFAQPQFSTRNAGMIAEAIGGEVLLADPLAYDWETNLLEQAQVFQRALR